MASFGTFFPMNSIRFAVLGAVLAAFIAGVWVGHYLAEPTSLAAPQESAVAGLSPTPGAPPPAAKQAAKLAEKMPPDPGLGAAQRFWSVLTIADERERQAAWLSMLCVRALEQRGPGKSRVSLPELAEAVDGLLRICSAPPA